MSDLFAPEPSPQQEAQPVPCPLCRCARSGYSGLFNTACAGCRARDIARGSVFWNAKHARPEHTGYEQSRQAYRDLLASNSVSHADVMHWSSGSSAFSSKAETERET